MINSVNVETKTHKIFVPKIVGKKTQENKEEEKKNDNDGNTYFVDRRKAVYISLLYVNVCI